MIRRAMLPVALGAALASCSSEQEASAPEAISADEQRALSQAAEMLEERPTDDAGAVGSATEPSQAAGGASGIP